MLIATPLEKDSFSSDKDFSYSLKEKVYNIQEDVNLIYNKFFKKIIDYVQEYEYIDKSILPSPDDSIIQDITSWGIITKASDIYFGGIMSSSLVSIDCKEADKKLPIPIFCGSFVRESYHFYYKEADTPPHIVISLRNDLFKMLLKSNMSDLEKQIPSKLFKRAKSELTEARVKGSIAHELSHWIDNSIYNIFELILGNSTTPEQKKRKLLLNQKNVNLTYFEIQGQIHAIHQIYKQNTDVWDDITLNDLFILYPALQVIAVKVYEEYGKEVLSLWIKLLLTRMSREQLLGKNMTSFSIDRLDEEIKRSIHTIY